MRTPPKSWRFTSSPRGSQKPKLCRKHLNKSPGFYRKTWAGTIFSPPTANSSPTSPPEKSSRPKLSLRQPVYHKIGPYIPLLKKRGFTALLEKKRKNSEGSVRNCLRPSG